MKWKDIAWMATLILISLFIFLPITNPIFLNLTTRFPYIMGFLKTMILASMGEILVRRIKSGRYFNDAGFIMKAIVWGFLGMMFVYVFAIFDGGVKSLFNQHVFFENQFFNQLVYALIISISMNLIFAPSFMLLHRVTDAYIHLSGGSFLKLTKIRMKDVISSIDFEFFFSFVLLKTIPFFWIPAHTLTFMLPVTYRVLMASYLSMVLGILLTFRKKP